jgi:hypothetical protein
LLLAALGLAALAMTHAIFVALRWLKRRQDRYEKGPGPDPYKR